MSTIVTRTGKGSALTWDEADANLTNLNIDKLESGFPASDVANTPTGSIVATNVQTALNELDTEKVAYTRLNDSDGSSLVGFLPAGTGAVATDVQSKLRESVSVFDFMTAAQIADIKSGAATLDVTAAIQAAIDSAPFGAKVLVPEGIYQTTGFTVKDGVTLCGEGSYSTVIRTTHASQTIITLNTSSTITDIKLISAVARTSGYHVDCVGNGTIIDNCEFGNYYIGVNVGVLGNPVIVSTLIKDSEFRDPSILVGGGAVQFINFSNAAMRNCIITGNIGTQPSFGVRYQNGDTAFLTDTNITTHGKALLIDSPLNTNIYALTITSCFFDSASGDSASVTPTGNLYNTRITNTWFGLAAGNGCYVAPQGAGKIEGLTFTGCEFTDNGDCGLLVVSAAVKNWLVIGGHAGGNTNVGVRVNSSSNFVISGVICGTIGDRGPNNFGISIDSSPSSNYSINNCLLVGNTSGAMSDLGSGTNIWVTNNVGYNGTAPVAGVTVTGSPFTYVAGHTPEMVYILGGTVSAVKLDGLTVQNTTGTTVVLQPNQSVQITYSVLPTVMKKIN